mmetsp:Transcript_10359/g.36422  ORF Transcript_10359/g.36422 Transcript_10359/m.36422 type:complete len:367 (+) Transcript_10359:1685-2785(+)
MGQLIEGILLVFRDARHSVQLLRMMLREGLNVSGAALHQGVADPKAEVLREDQFAAACHGARRQGLEMLLFLFFLLCHVERRHPCVHGDRQHHLQLLLMFFLYPPDGLSLLRFQSSCNLVHLPLGALQAPRQLRLNGAHDPHLEEHGLTTFACDRHAPHQALFGCLSALPVLAADGPEIHPAMHCDLDPLPGTDHQAPLQHHHRLLVRGFRQLLSQSEPLLQTHPALGVNNSFPSTQAFDLCKVTSIPHPAECLPSRLLLAPSPQPLSVAGVSPCDHDAVELRLLAPGGSAGDGCQPLVVFELGMLGRDNGILLRGPGRRHRGLAGLVLGRCTRGLGVPRGLGPLPEHPRRQRIRVAGDVREDSSL